MRPEATKLTLGKPFDQVTGPALLAGSDRILKVARGESEQDDRDSLQFKDLFSAEDLIAERMVKKHKWDIKRKLTNNVDKQDRIRNIVNPDIFGKPVKNFFTQSSLTERPDQMNPMSYISGNRRTTIRGEGGISKAHQVTMGAKVINPSHTGFLDPIQTPESEKIGTTLQLSLGVRKRGNEIEIPAIDAKTNKMVWLDPGQALNSNLAYPDQYTRVGGELKPVGKLVKITDPKGQTTMAKPGDVDYILNSTKGMFDLSANLIPYLQNNQGNRTMVAAKQIEQAVSLVNREEPLVKVKGERGSNTFEDMVGKFTAHRAPFAGTVVQVKKDGIVLRDKEGERHEVQLYNNFPLNDDKSMLQSYPLVKKGDEVKKDQVIADNNFTRNGSLALGTSLNVAYMPYKGYNFEDGIVISDSASRKLTSDHLFRSNVSQEKNTILDKKKLKAEIGAVTPKSQIDKLDDDAVIREGEVVEPGDILIGALKHEELTPEKQKMALFGKGRVKPVRPQISTWDKDVSGQVVRVTKHGKKTTVYVQAQTPADIGDKIVGRHGNKGIITAILPDHEMPHNSDGKPAEVLLNPTGVPTRINLGQVLETAASKIAKAKGKPYIVDNFDPTNTDYTRNLKKELDKLGLSDTEEMFDPVSKRSYGQVLTGDQYIYKLHHTAAKGLSTRSREAYDSNMTPRKGGPHGGQTMDAMGIYAMLAHNARENVREMQTYKSDFNDDFWAALQAGESIPTPKVPFVFKKFEGYLKGMGIDIDKQGNDLILTPLTDKKVLAMSNGQLKNAGATLVGRNLKPEPEGIFDPKKTGTLGIGALGDKWTHITLSERMPNPVFEKPIQSLLGLSKSDYDNVINSRQELNGKTGPEAIVDGLEKIDIGKERKSLEEEIPNLRTMKLNQANRKLKYLRALDRAEMDAQEAYTMKHLPVLPPTMRPVSVLDNGSLNLDDVNKLYTMIANSNDKLQEHDPKVMPEEEAYPLRSELYDGLKALTLTGAVNKGRHLNAIATTIAGKGQPKEGFFQDKIIGRRQDLSMRGTIVPEPSMSLDEVGIPRKAAQELYKPFIVRRLVHTGMTPLQAQKQVKENTPAAAKALEYVTNERPLLLKRDPVLHKFGVQAFRPKLIESKAIKIHPLVTSGYNADFDGDKMSAFVPVSNEAVKEAFKMFPSNNLFSPSNGNLMFKPSHESMLGLYKLTEMQKKAPVRFKNIGDAAKAVKDGKIDFTTPINIDNLDMSVLDKLGATNHTTVGRVMVYSALPEELRDQKILSDPLFKLDKKNLQSLLTNIGHKEPGDFSKSADKLKDLGNEYSTGLSMGLEDFFSDKASRDPVLKTMSEQESKIRASAGKPEKKEQQLVNLYSKAATLISDRAKTKADESNNRMYDWVRSGARGNWDQFKQMTVAPMLVADAQGKTVPIPISKSYSEGLDIGSYWAAMHGARMGTISRVEGTWRPGLAGKQIMQTTMDQMIVDDDCGTNKGLRFSINDRDLLGRYSVGDIKLGNKAGKDKGIIPSGTLITPDLINRLKNNKVSDIRARSPLKCIHGKGLCAKCYGTNENGELQPIGTNVGIIAAQALGEPATQLSMNAFHTGGVVGAKGTTAVSTFDRLDQLLGMPKTLPGAAVLSNTDGDVDRVQKDPAGGWSVFIKGQRHYVPSSRDLLVRKGSKVKKGEAITSGPKNPREMLKLVGKNPVQSYLVDEIQKVYQNEAPLSRRNTETFVRALTNLSLVKNAGDHPELLPGDHAPTSKIEDFNSKLQSGKKPVTYEPILSGVDMLPLELQEDWLARLQSRNLRSTVLDAASEGWRSEVHSTHPIPGMAYGKEFGKGTPENPHLY
jgi:DNA-directed RNA polymerase subunit beta'